MTAMAPLAPSANSRRRARGRPIVLPSSKEQFTASVTYFPLMNITDVKAVYVDHGPGPRPISDGGYRDQKRVFGYVEVFTDGGLTGFCPGAAPPSLVEHELQEMIVGENPLEEDVARVVAVREAIGPDVGLMIDANHAWTPYEAIRFVREVERCNIGWLEEPVYPWDHQGCAEVARVLEVPVATGENVSSRFAFRDMIDAHACDIVQADALYCGGLTEWRKIAAYAAAHSLPMAPHGNAHIGAHCVGGVQNGLIVEVGMYAGRQPPRPPIVAPLEVNNGVIQLTDAPGFGFVIDRDAIKWN